MRIRWVVLLGLAVVVVSACRTEGLAFRQDDRVAIVHPADRQTVQLPMTVDWEIEDDLSTAGSRGVEEMVFGVFIDRRPQPPGETLQSLAEDDETCQATPGCPDAEWLATRGVYRTTATSLEIDSLPDLRSGRRSDVRDRHEIVIVLLDANDRRISESTFSVEFFLERSESQTGSR